MDTRIREKLDRIDELFPAERLAKSKERWRRLWAAEKPLDRLPYIVEPMFAYYDVSPAEERLNRYLDHSISRGFVDDDFIPSFFPGCRQGTIPSMFGAREIIAGDDYTCEKILLGPEDAARLPEPSLGEGTIAHEWLALARYVAERTEGRFPVHVTDMQGPVDVAGQLWGYEDLYIAAYTQPEVYDALLEKTTRAFIRLWKAQKEALGPLFIGTHLTGYSYLPEGFGATVSVDSLVMVSGDFYERFFRPYLTRISEEFGGLVIHSCGNFQQLIPQLLATPNIRGLNASQMSPSQLYEAGIDGRLVLISGEYYPRFEEAMQYIRSHGLRAEMTVGDFWPRRNGGLKPVQDWNDTDYDEMKRKQDHILNCMRSE